MKNALESRSQNLHFSVQAPQTRANEYGPNQKKVSSISELVRIQFASGSRKESCDV
jgi:hypothetical protein